MFDAKCMRIRRRLCAITIQTRKPHEDAHYASLFVDNVTRPLHQQCEYNLSLPCPKVEEDEEAHTSRTGPFAGMLLADYGATVLRLDRAPTQPSTDQLTRRKTSICVNMKSAAGIALIKKMIPHVDVVIDPFRPGVLEKLGLSPEDVLLKLNPRLIIGRMTGFRRDGKYSMMAGHDINYIAVSGVLSLFGRKGEKPYPPGNVVGDFAGGGAMCFIGILLALLSRERTGFGQVVEANMVDGSAVLASMPRLGLKTQVWNRERGTNMLDGGAPFYDTYETKDGKYMAV